MYIIYFFASLLHSLVILSKVFQYKYGGVTTIGYLIKIQIKSICMSYVVKSIDLNQDTFNTSIDYHVILQYDPIYGYLQRLSSKIKRSKFQSANIIRDPNNVDLEDALNFQKTYAKVKI